MRWSLCLRCAMTFNCSFGRFTGQLTASDPLQTVFQLLSGRIPAVAAVQHPEHKLFTRLNRHSFSYDILKISVSCQSFFFFFFFYWCSVPSAAEMKNGETGGPIWLLCSLMRREILTSNRKPSSTWETLSVRTHWLTGRLMLFRHSIYASWLFCVALHRAAFKGLLHAAHVCYLTAGVPFGAFTQKADRLVLLGSSHRWAVLVPPVYLPSMSEFPLPAISIKEIGL